GSGNDVIDVGSAEPVDNRRRSGCDTLWATRGETLALWNHRHGQRQVSAGGLAADHDALDIDVEAFRLITQEAQGAEAVDQRGRGWRSGPQAVAYVDDVPAHLEPWQQVHDLGVLVACHPEPSVKEHQGGLGCADIATGVDIQHQLGAALGRIGYV